MSYDAHASNIWQQQLDEIRAAGLFKGERVHHLAAAGRMSAWSSGRTC